MRLTRPDPSAVRDHAESCTSNISIDNFKIVGNENNVHDLRLLESLHILKSKPSLNDHSSAVQLNVVVTPPPWERYLNWVHEDHPPHSRDHGKENLPPPEEPRKLPRKMRPRRKQRKHHQQHRIITGSQPG